MDAHQVIIRAGRGRSQDSPTAVPRSTLGAGLDGRPRSDHLSRIDRAHVYTGFDQLRTVTSARVVIWSAAPQQVYVDDRAHGVAAFLSKPFDLDELLALLTALVAARP